MAAKKTTKTDKKPKNTSFEIGSRVVTTKEHRCFVKALPAGSEVEIVGIDEQGRFQIKDETGYVMTEVREI